MNEWIWLDADGSFVDLYGVDNWLDDLVNLKTRPYEVAKPIYNMVDFLEVLIELKAKGYNIGLISWLAKNPDVDFAKRTTQAKMEWLTKYCMDLILDEILIVPYGKCKADVCRKYGNGILVDDEEQNRNAWYLGDTINANENILELLKKLL